MFSSIIKEPKVRSQNNKPIDQDYKVFEGKIIRNIQIKVLQPFGTNIYNPDSVNRRNKFNNTLNRLHVNTNQSVILNNLLFEQGEKVNPAIIAESETFLRNAGYINDARITIDSISGINDSVDVQVIVRDIWSIGATVQKITPSALTLNVFDKNILGSGNRLGVDFLFNSDYSKKFGFGGEYLYKNVAKTFIDLDVSYLDKMTAEEIALSAERKLHPSLHYFGEVSYHNRTLRPHIVNWDSITPDRYEDFSVSFGKAIDLPGDYAVKRLVLSGHYKQKSPEYRNEVYQDYFKDKYPPYRFIKNRIWLLQLSLYQQAYYREYLIHNFGVTEDIAHGYNLSLQFGYSQFDQYKDAFYGSLSGAFSTGKLAKGLLHAESSISSFLNNEEPFEGVFKLGLHYYSPLFSSKIGRLRQFINVNYSKLLSSQRYFGDEIYFGSSTTLETDDLSKSTRGVERLIIKSESDLFSKLEIAGFRFLFYNFVDVGWITPKNNLFHKDNFYWGIGAGIRIRNDVLVFNTLDIKFGFYPNLNQSNFGRIFNIDSSTPKVSPNFVPEYPKEIFLE